MKTIKKAYKINFDKIEDGFLASGHWCYAENRNEAKKKLLNEIIYDEWKLKYCDEPINYLTIPVLRCKELDLVEFEGKEIKRCRIEDIIRERERHVELDKILNNPDVKFCYIVKAGVYYKPNNCGYTQDQQKAGVYEKEDAVKSAKSCDELWVRPINIEEHNRIINGEIEILRNNLIITLNDYEDKIRRNKA